jgi:hypothetical protein
MTLKRALAMGAVGVLLVVGAAQAGWFYQSGKWYYTPDVGTEVTYKGVPNPETQSSYIQWTLTTGSYGCACRNNGGNFASEVVSVEPVVLTAVDPIDSYQFDKTKGLATALGHIETETLCTPERVTCQNANWYLDPDYDLIYTFTATSEAFVWDKKLGDYQPVAGSQVSYNCHLRDQASYSPLNLPPAGWPYDCP